MVPTLIPPKSNRPTEKGGTYTVQFQVHSHDAITMAEERKDYSVLPRCSMLVSCCPLPVAKVYTRPVHQASR